MLSTTLQNQNELIADLKEQLQKGTFNFSDLQPIAGSFKQVAQIKDNLGIAWNLSQSNAGLDMLQKEIKLLNFMKSFNFPAICVYSDPIKVTNNQWAVLVEWVSNATYIDVKDTNLHCKLSGLMINYPVPAQEGWAIQKEKIDKEIEQKVKSEKDIFEKAQILATKLHTEFATIQTVIETKKYLIADLQLLITPSGTIKIIDPIDIVKINSTNIPNQYEYQSILDSTNQQNPDFIKLVLDGKRLITQTKDWCLALSKLPKEEFLNFILSPSFAEEEAAKCASLTMSNLLLQRKNLGKKPRSAQTSNTGKKIILSTRAAPIVCPPSLENTVQKKTPPSSPQKATQTVLKEISPPNSPDKSKVQNKKTPPSSPEKSKNLIEQKENSPTKALNFHFSALKVVARRLDFDQPNEKAIAKKITNNFI